MDKTLSTIYLQVKSETRTLTNSAIAQILVKIIYSKDHRLSFNEIVSLYKDFTKRKTVSEDILQEILTRLCSTDEIKLSVKNEYYITDSKRKQIKAACESSRKRREDIINRFFSRTHSDPNVIASWLQDVSLHFFKCFSDEWISDLLKTKDAIIHSRDSIREMIIRRTRNIKGIDKKDYDTLPKLFFDFICSKEADVTAYLWEYGTSAFSAKLISNTAGVDALTLEVFKGSKCLLDTNILIFIKLEASKYHNALISIEKAFKKLGVEIGVLHITKEEYQHKIDCQKQVTIKNLEKMGYKLTSSATDDFTQSAISLQCRKKEDFETFFEGLRILPKYLNECLPINVIDDDNQLIDNIETAQKDENKKEHLNSIFLKATGRDKRQTALTHDVGLIAGVEFLRDNEKWFILSEEISVNNYSKIKPAVNGLPISLRVSTLINVLALNNGGDCFEANDYMQLFASIIQNELQPSKETFAQEDLYAIYDLNHQIALLPDEQKETIVMEIHEKKLKGENNETLKVELERAITRGKLQISDDLSDTKKELYNTQKEAERQQKRGDDATRALRSKIQNEIKSDYQKKICYWIIVPFLGIPTAVFVILWICNFIWLNFDNSGQSIGFIVNIIASIVCELLYFILYGIKKINSIVRGKPKFFRDELEKRMNEALKEQ